jgi:sugar phosphate isomerase/epimerase
MGTDDVVPIRAAHHSLSGCRHGEEPKHTLLARATAAHAAGITEIGACAADLGVWDPAELRHLIRCHHVRVRELEWVDLGQPDQQAEEDLFRLADITGARQLNAGVCDSRMYPESYLATRLRFIAEVAADHDMTVAFEPVAFGSLCDVVAVQHLIEMAGQPNVGTLLDVYHMARDPLGRWDALDGIEPELVAGIQISGISQVSWPVAWPLGLLEEAQNGRLLPDAGDFPVESWLQALLDKGVQARLSVEILSDEQRACTLYQAADRVAASSAKFSAMWEAAS